MTIREPQSRVRLLTIAVVVALLISSCGGDEAATTTTTTEATTTTTEATTTSNTSTTVGSTTSDTVETSSTTTTEPSTTTTGSSTTAAETVVEVYFSTGDGTDCSQVAAFDRTVEDSVAPALAAFEELVGGPTAPETAAGASSFFSASTAEAVRSVSMTGGVLTVDFEDIRMEISNAGTSCGSAAFTSSLNATAFQFPTVDSTRFLFAGSCEDFGGFIQTDFCEFDREG